MERIPIIEHREGKLATIAPHLRETNKGTYTQRRITREELGKSENPREDLRAWLEKQFANHSDRLSDIKTATGDAFNNALGYGVKQGEHRSAITILWLLRKGRLEIAIHNNIPGKGGLTKDKILKILSHKQSIFRQQMGIEPKRASTDRLAQAIGETRGDGVVGGRGFQFMNICSDKGSAIYLGPNGKYVTTHLVFKLPKQETK